MKPHCDCLNFSDALIMFAKVILFEAGFVSFPYKCQLPV